MLLNIYVIKHAKRKGSSLENRVVQTLRDAGIPAERVPLSGALKSLPGDVVVGELAKPLKRIECKNREDISKRIWEWLEDNDALIIKRNHSNPLVVVTLDDYIDLIKSHLIGD